MMEKSTLICPKCGESLDAEKIAGKKYICSCCGTYLRMNSIQRINMVADKNSFVPWFEEVKDSNPLKDDSYAEKIKVTREKTGLNEAVTVGYAEIFGEPLVLGVCDSAFMMGSMGQVVGERITRAIERATEERLPVFLFCSSGGARMQEGIISLMQMEKTAAAVRRHSDAELLYCPILTDPTTGGVTASFAMLGDVIMAEPGALIGFAGQRVITQTMGQELPEGFQTAEFQEQHGMIDGIVRRNRLRKVMQFLILTHRKKEVYVNFRTDLNFKMNPDEYEIDTKSDVLTAWQKVKEVRKTRRPSSLDYITRIFDVFVELKGDRNYRDDRALIGGIALLEGQPVTILAEERGHEIQESIKRNFGMPMPEGFRKALRLMKEAEKFNRPIISFINTPGAFCGVDAEERGQGEAIARNLYEMSALKVPVLCILIGEGGSGGALATAVGNEVWMLENATYSILTPEGYASIIWKDTNKAPAAAELMKSTAQDLKELGIIEKIIPEYGCASKDNVDQISSYLKKRIIDFLTKMSKKDMNEIVNERYERFRRF